MTTADEASGASWRRRVLTGERRSEDEIRDAVFLFSGDVFAKRSRFWLAPREVDGVPRRGGSRTITRTE
jgi:hypothetical protein